MGKPVRFVKVEPDAWYYFTFGHGHEHYGYYVKIKGTYAVARAKMFERYGDKWAFQYSEEDWQKIIDDPHRWWPMEEELEVIE